MCGGVQFTVGHIEADTAVHEISPPQEQSFYGGGQSGYFIGGDNHCRNLFNVIAMSPGNAIDFPAISSGTYSSCGRLSVM